MQAPSPSFGANYGLSLAVQGEEHLPVHVVALFGQGRLTSKASSLGWNIGVTVDFRTVRDKDDPMRVQALLNLEGEEYTWDVCQEFSLAGRARFVAAPAVLDGFIFIMSGDRANVKSEDINGVIVGQEQCRSDVVRGNLQYRRRTQNK